ncbi:MAG: haloacid dehalogenase type II [Thermomicrobiales bacterium]
MSLDFTAFDVLTFDCYGTLIDWETGIVNAMRPILEHHDILRSDEEILTIFSESESIAQQLPYKTYEEVLAEVADRFGERLDFEPTAEERIRFSRSVADWPAFRDSTSGLRTLGEHYDLVILSNVDDDLFNASAEKLDVEFADVITAQQVGSYKPNLRNFEVLLDRLNKPKDRILHVAQSLFHDIAPANEIGLHSIWVNRRHGRGGTGATPPQHATPDLEVPDLATLASMVTEAFGDNAPSHASP